MTNEEREKHIRIANMLIGAINDLIRPILMYQIEKDVTREALENYIKMLEQQPCEDCISREAVITKIEDEDRLSFMGVFCDHDAAMGFRETIKELPSVTPSRPKGKWIGEESLDGSIRYMCSNCKEFECVDYYSFCPNCGADMTESEE